MLQVSELVRATGPEFQVVVGSAQTFYASLCVGAVGGVLALACVQPALCTELRALTLSGRHDEALALQQRLTPLALNGHDRLRCAGSESRPRRDRVVGRPTSPATVTVLQRGCRENSAGGERLRTEGRDGSGGVTRPGSLRPDQSTRVAPMKRCRQ